VEDNIVVSDIGEQWSPKTDPDKTEANVAKNMGDSTVALGDIFKRCIAIGTTTGTSIDMVAQDEPVEKLMAAAVTKVMKGSMVGDKILEEILTKYSAVFRSLHNERKHGWRQNIRRNTHQIFCCFQIFAYRTNSPGQH